MLRLMYIGYSTAPSMRNQWWLMDTGAAFDLGVHSFGACKPTKQQVRKIKQGINRYRAQFGV
ncbi:hypothetical protein [Vibrio phage JSF7]|uniref:Uncharacterized protein n=1 Tax=Vibrio phage JSF7 TaxID=1292086 RepID=A0A240EWV2_9CAUD|nr:hypothetical protein HOQ92_gp19 [Vibrio phage JSF7]APD18143.1 hypothetical protein [Vibrio phage JSF7]